MAQAGGNQAAMVLPYFLFRWDQHISVEVLLPDQSTSINQMTVDLNDNGRSLHVRVELPETFLNVDDVGGNTRTSRNRQRLTNLRLELLRNPQLRVSEFQINLQEPASFVDLSVHRYPGHAVLHVELLRE